MEFFDEVLNFFSTENGVILIKIINLIADVFLVFLFALYVIKNIKVKFIERRIKKLEEEMSKNKISQMEDEKKMANLYFDCDLCGKKVKVGTDKAFKYKDFDLCEKCGEMANSLTKNYEKAKIELEEKNKNFSRAKESLESFTKNFVKANNDKEEKEIKEEIVEDCEKEKSLKDWGIV